MNETNSWYCDTCDKPISDAGRGNVTWKIFEDLTKSDFHIVHKGECDTDRGASSWELKDSVGLGGQNFLLSFLSPGPLKSSYSSERVSDSDEFVDLFRRLQTPGYEEARRYLRTESVTEAFSDANEMSPYTEHGISRIIELGRSEL